MHGAQGYIETSLSTGTRSFMVEALMCPSCAVKQSRDVLRWWKRRRGMRILNPAPSRLLSSAVKAIMTEVETARLKRYTEATGIH